MLNNDENGVPLAMVTDRLPNYNLRGNIIKIAIERQTNNCIFIMTKD